MSISEGVLATVTWKIKPGTMGGALQPQGPPLEHDRPCARWRLPGYSTRSSFAAIGRVDRGPTPTSDASIRCEARKGRDAIIRHHAKHDNGLWRRLPIRPLVAIDSLFMICSYKAGPARRPAMDNRCLLYTSPSPRD